MATLWRVVDLFAGPGGLSEGFARARRTDGAPACEVVLSVEKDAAACTTLRLRHALRRLERLPRSYLDWLADPLAGAWPPVDAAAWRAAEEAVLQRELGRPGVFEELEPRLRRLRERSHGATILIGGPPCQAYSIIGRARNAGNPGYDPGRDGRHFLYREYLRILDVLRPAAFVMENVPGLLSARVGRERIFPRILEDLASIGRGADGYELLPFGAARPGRVDVRDFVVRAEEHGVPQARRRVFVIGVRRDLLPPLLPQVAPRPPVAAGAVLAGLEPLRSGLSRRDSWPAWRDAVLDATAFLGHIAPRTMAGGERFVRALRELGARFEGAAPRSRTATRPPEVSPTLPEELRGWLAGAELPRTPNHETRGHMREDLVRYLFAALFARTYGRSPERRDFPPELAPRHRSWEEGKFADRFRVQLEDRPASTVTSHIAKDGHYYIHPDPLQCRSLTVREAARLQTFPDDYVFLGNRTQQYVQVGNAVPPLLARRIAEWLVAVLEAGACVRPAATQVGAQVA